MDWMGLAYIAGAAVLGWLSKHYGVIGPASPVPVGPVGKAATLLHKVWDLVAHLNDPKTSDPSPEENVWLSMLKQVLDGVVAQPKQDVPPAPPAK